MKKMLRGIVIIAGIVGMAAGIILMWMKLEEMIGKTGRIKEFFSKIAKRWFGGKTDAGELEDEDEDGAVLDDHTEA